MRHAAAVIVPSEHTRERLAGPRARARPGEARGDAVRHRRRVLAGRRRRSPAVPPRGRDAAAAQEPGDGAARVRAARGRRVRAPLDDRRRARLARHARCWSASPRRRRPRGSIASATSVTRSCSRSIAAPPACCTRHAPRASGSRRWRRWRAARPSSRRARGACRKSSATPRRSSTPTTRPGWRTAVADVLGGSRTVARARPRARRRLQLGALRGADGGRLPARRTSAPHHLVDADDPRADVWLSATAPRCPSPWRRACSACSRNCVLKPDIESEPSAIRKLAR